MPANSGDASGWGEGGSVVVSAALKGMFRKGKILTAAVARRGKTST